jgi:hypothetical protein
MDDRQDSRQFKIPSWTVLNLFFSFNGCKTAGFAGVGCVSSYWEAHNSAITNKGKAFARAKGSWL